MAARNIKVRFCMQPEWVMRHQLLSLKDLRLY